MFKTRSKKIYRDVLARKGRSILVILSITMGVFGVATMMSITDLLNRQLAEDIKSEQISHTKVYVVSGDDGSTAEQNQAYFDALLELPGVIDVEGQAVYPVVWHDGEQPQDAVMIAFNEPVEDATLEAVSRLVAGRYPAAGEIAVEPRFAEANGLAIGDKLRFPSTGDREWEIVGFLLHPYYTEYPDMLTQVMVEEKIFANYADARAIVGFAGLSAIHVRYENTPQALAGQGDLVAAVNRETSYVAFFTYQDDPENNFVVSIFGELTGALDGLGFIAMIVSGFLVTNVMNIIIMEQRTQIGAMKSLGAKFGDIFLIYGGMALFYGAIGTALGLLLAVPAAANAARPVANWASVYIEGNQVSPVGVGIGTAMGLLIPVLAAMFPIWQASRVSILDTLTDLGIASDWGQSRLARAIGRLPLPIFIVQALNNIWHRKGRLALTGLTLTAAVGAFMGAFAVSDSMDSYMVSMVGIHNYDIRIDLQRPEDYAQMTTLINANSDAVSGVFPGFEALVQVPGFASNMPLNEGSDQVRVAGFDPAAPMYDFDFLDGMGWQIDPTRAGIVITRPLADVLDKQVGDALTIVIDEQPYDYEIIGIDSYVFENIFMDWRELSRLMGVVGGVGEPRSGTAFVMLAGNPSIEQIDDKIDELTALLSADGIQATYINQPASAAVQVEQPQMLGTMFQMMAMVMAVVGAIGLTAALSMAVLERQKEIGVMRSVGARSRTIMAQFMLEGILIGVLAWIQAIPLSVWMSLSFLAILPVDYLTLEYPPQLVLLGLSGVLVVVTLASLGPSFMASRKTVADILRYQ